MNIKLLILRVLKTVDPMAQMKAALKDEAELLAGGKVGDGEFAEALVFLQHKGWIDTRVDDMTGDTRYYITNTGKTKAAQ